MSGEDVVAAALAEAFWRRVGGLGRQAPPELQSETARIMRSMLDDGVIVPGPAGEPTAEELEHDKVLDRAGGYVSPGAGGGCSRHGRIYTGSACPACEREVEDA